MTIRLAVALIGFGIVSAAYTVAQEPIQRLGDVKKIFVAPLGTGDGSDLIREKVIGRLIKSGKIIVVESPDDADATLTGIAETSKGVRYSADSGAYSGSASGGTTYHANLVVRLVGKSRQVLWAGEATPRFFGSRSASSNVADKMVKDLIKAIEKSKAPLGK